MDKIEKQNPVNHVNHVDSQIHGYKAAVFVRDGTGSPEQNGGCDTMAVINDLIQRRARRAVEVVAQQAPVRAAYVFGSQAEGTADEFSDIDLAAFD